MDISKIFDEYELKARLRPALIIFFPAVFACYFWFPELRKLSSAIISLLTTVGVLTLMAKLSRNFGKAKENLLYEKWGGKPTTSFLRYNNTFLDPATKSRYRLFLEKSVDGLILPNDKEELEDRKNADDLYESAIRWLREKTRDKKQYPLVFKDNISYGFSRNLWAMKPIGIAVSIATFLINIAIAYYKTGNDILNLPYETWIIATISLVMTFIWIFLINSNWVRNEAEAYARSLLATCEKLSKPTRRTKPKKTCKGDSVEV